MNRLHLALASALTLLLIALTATVVSAKGLKGAGADEPPVRNGVPWPDLFFDENELLERTTVVLDLRDYFDDDQDERNLRFDIDQTSRQIINGFGIRFTGRDTLGLSFQFQPFYNTWGRMADIVIRCIDPTGGSVSDVLPASIDSINYPPQPRGEEIVFEPTTETDEPIVGDIGGSGLMTKFWDPDTNLIRFTIGGGPDELGLSINQAPPQLIHYNIVANYNTAYLAGGEALVFVSAIDACDEFTVRSFRMCVRPDANDSISAGEAGNGFEYLTPPDEYRFAQIDSAVLIPFTWNPAIQNPWETDSIAYHFSVWTPGSQDSIWAVVIDSTSLTIPMDSILHRWRSPDHPGRFSCGWRVYAVDRAGIPLRSLSGSWRFIPPHPESVIDPASTPNEFVLSEVYPNPFNSSTTIRFSTGPINREATSLRVYGVDGRLVKEMWIGRDTYSPGEHSVQWNAGGIAAGVYLVRLEGAGRTEARKVVLVR